MSSKIICELQKLNNGNDFRLELQSYSFSQLSHLRNHITQAEKLVSVDLFRQSDKDTAIIAGSIGKVFPKMKIITVLDGKNTVLTFNNPMINEIRFRGDNGETTENISVNFVGFTVETIAPIGADWYPQTSRVKTGDKMFKKTMDSVRS